MASDFIKNYLPESIREIIDMETLELQKDSLTIKNSGIFSRKTVMKLLMKKCAVLPAGDWEKIGQLDVITLEMINDEIRDCDSLVTIKKYLID